MNRLCLVASLDDAPTLPGELLDSPSTDFTPLEPEWEGHVTLEFSNTTPLPAKIYAREGCAQVLFIESDEVCETSYRDRGGKYQGQMGVTLPRT